MLRRLRRPLGMIVPALLLTGLVASCGSSASDNALGKSADRLDAVSISGDVGAVPVVAWKDTMDAGTPKTETLVTGDGPTLAAGDQVLFNYYVADGFTKKEVFNTFGPAKGAGTLTVGTPTQLSQTSTVDDLVPQFISTQVQAGMTIGTRLAITANSMNVFGQNVLLPQVAAKDIGNDEGLLLVVDIEQQVLPGPDGQAQQAPRWSPAITYAKGLPTALDFAGTPTPNKQLRVGILKKGTGPAVTKNDEIVVNYLGQVYQGAKPFDESFSKAPYPTQIGVGSVVKGWDQALVGLPVGTRVMLSIPPALGYGKAGQGDTIPGDSTLFFVIDILGSA